MFLNGGVLKSCMIFLQRLFVLLPFGSSCSTTQSLPDLKVVPNFSIERYMGTWYEIANFPQRFQKGCVATTAQYSLRADGQVDVLNSCRRGSFDAPLKSGKAVAWVEDPAEPAKLLVQFFWPFSGKYWVIDLGPEYEYAVVGHPSREYLWILSRTPQMDDNTYEQILQRLKNRDYDVTKIVRTAQQPTN